MPFLTRGVGSKLETQSKGNRTRCSFLTLLQKNAMENPKKIRSDSANAAILAMQNAANEIQLPEGIELRDESEVIIWRQFTRARAREAWRDFDLVLLSKAVRIEADLRKYQETLDKSGPLIKNKRETWIENPLLRVVDTLQRQQLAIIRSMSLTQTGQDPRTMNDNALVEKEALGVLKQNGAESLLAMPIRH